jgi:hypothetical protein
MAEEGVRTKRCLGGVIGISTDCSDSGPNFTVIPAAWRLAYSLDALACGHRFMQRPYARIAPA